MNITVNRNQHIVTLLAFFLAIAVLSCQNKGDVPEQRSADRRELTACAIKTAIEIEPKDVSTSAEDGGYGFEKIAETQGFKTYTFTEEDLKYFGEPEATKGGVLVEITPRFPATMRTEGKNSNYLENSVFGQMLYEGLLDIHPVTLEFIPSLASHWKISDDKMKYTFRINPDARWSDGKEVTAEDIIATYDLRMDETILAPSSQLVFGKMKRPVAESKYIVSVECRELNWRNFLYFSGMEIFPAHYIKGLSGTDYLKEYQLKALPGTGPYTILEEDIKNQLSYAVTRRLDYWDGDNPVKRYQYNFDKIKFIVVKDNRSLEWEKFKKGEQDYFDIRQSRRWAEETNSEAFQKGWIQKRKIYSEKPAGTKGYAFNMRKWPFNDRRIRLAFCYLLNRKKLNEELFFNDCLLQDSVYAGSVYENPDNEKIRYNPEKAVELLAEAGFKQRNNEGWLVNDEGKVLRIEFGIPKVIEYRVTPYQQMLKEYGIDLQIQFIDENALWKIMMERNFTLMYENWGGLIFPNPETTFHSKLANKDNNNNIFGFADPRVDELLDRYDQEFEQSERVKILREIDGIVADTRPSLWTFYRYDTIAFWNKFSHPDYLAERYIGDYRSIYKLWWFDKDKLVKLEEAMKNKSDLDSGEVEVRYWKDFQVAIDNELSKTEK